MSWSFPPCFLQIALALIFRFLIHFELIFVWYKVWVQFHSFACGYSVFPAPFAEKTVLSPLNGLDTLVRTLWPYIWGFISGLSLLFHCSKCLSLCQCHAFLITCSFVISFEIRKYESSKICSSLSRLFWGTSLVTQWLRIHLPMQGTQVWSLVREDPTWLSTTKPVCHNYWARVPQLLKPTCLEPMLCNKRSHSSEKPTHCHEE